MSGKVIAAIGLCHQFVNDPVLLRATNQEAFTAQDHMQSESMNMDDNEESKPSSSIENKSLSQPGNITEGKK